MAWPAVLALGEPMIEFNHTAPDQPNYLRGAGGDTSNAIIACARQGVPYGYITRLGDDDFGNMFLDLWRAEGIDTEGVSLDPAARNVMLKFGRQGCIAATQSRRTSIAGHPVDAVDATGVGDCFDGALLARLHAGDDLASAVRYANAAAALTTTDFGAVAPLPTWE